ncbi:flagellar basal body L-ring protein FlgH [Tolumonas lignilytica]|uniref:flagellar basal body L-ring protein FlgH n=1 Tax=Tolumonas lignilytica TaxID=1283284 RepID=UPI000467D7AC|nr:flagellar basal body L-ring protein FlgH [Tolumonas lignilytica]
MRNCALIIACICSLTACTSLPNSPKPDDPNYAPTEPEDYQANMKPNGSIFNQGAVNSIYSDIKAHRIGDIITVELQESTSSSKNASNQQSKDSSLGLNALSLGGHSVTLNGYNTTASMGGNNSFKGQAKAGQSNSLTGNISVSVIRVLPNGNLAVRGEKWLMLTEGNEYIRMTGVVRSEDVNADNTVSSQRIANARIQYGGTGDFANSEERGWLSKFFNGPYSPF